jgi:hypothetical protein
MVYSFLLNNCSTLLYIKRGNNRDKSRILGYNVRSGVLKICGDCSTNYFAGYLRKYKKIQVL